MRVAVYGSGGHGKVVADILFAEEHHEVVAYLDDDPSKEGVRIGKLAVRAAGERLKEVARDLRIEGVALGIGDNTVRARIVERCQAASLHVVRAVHPRSVIAPSVELGEGVVVMAGVVVNPFSRLEEGSVVNTSASVDHDCTVHRYAHVFPGARLAGAVEVGEFSYIGMGASVIQNRRVGARATVGAGAVVLADIEDGTTVVGVPARRIKP